MSDMSDERNLDHDGSESIEQNKMLQRLVTGDPGAFEELFGIFWHDLVAYADRMLQDQQAAADVVQEVLSALWVRRVDLNPSSSLRSFLYRATRNAVIDVMRRRKVRSRWMRRQIGEEQTVAETPEEVFSAEELRAAAERAIQALPARRREVFVLAHLHGLSYAEIGALIGVAPQTVANHMSLALADLRRSLQSFLPLPPQSPTPPDKS